MTALIFASTFSKDPRMFGLPKEVAVESANGTALVLVDYSVNPPKKMIVKDFCGGLGTNLMGMDNPAQRRHLQKFSFCAPSLPHSLEYSVADKLAALLGSHVPGWTPEGLGVRWCKTGSEATQMATRLARAVTGREYILCFEGAYHGWGAEFIARTEPAWGLRFSDDKDERGFVYGIYETPWANKQGAFEWGKNIAGDIAAVIFEQPATDPAPDWYPFLRQWCTENGALLVADETVTGLRYGLGGASERYGIEPDLLCMGKALGNGLPINALVGRREYMEWFSREGPVFCSSTYWGEVAGLAAADWVLDNWDIDKVRYIWRLGDDLMRRLGSAGWDVFGHGARNVLRFQSEVERAWFIQGMLERGYLFNRPQFISTAHTPEDVARAGKAAAEVRREWEWVGEEEAAVLMAGKMPRVLFKER